MSSTTSPARSPATDEKDTEALWHFLSTDAVVDRLQTDPEEGLESEEAARRLEEYGPNRLPEEEGTGPFIRFLKQFHNVLIYILLFAVVFTAFLGEWIDSGVIAAVVLVNAIVGFVQEGKAEEALEGIRSLLSPEATVVRGGSRARIDAEELVPGDIVRLDSGDRVPADLRILRSRDARVEEAILTGESEPVSKTSEPTDEKAVVADRTSMVFSGTIVAAGRITGVVVRTGQETEIGRIGEMVSGVEGVSTPLLRQIDRFGRHLSIAIVAGSVAIFFFAWLVRGYSATESFLAVVALAVAAIPEGLPAILTITLALGVQRMAVHKAIIRRLPAVETLGSVTVICTDKTGTLTRNEMAAERVFLDHGEWEISGSGFLPEGEFRWDGEVREPHDDPILIELIRTGLLCNEAEINDAGEEDGGRQLQGDPTDGALLVLAEKAGVSRTEEDEVRPQVDLLPFESERRWMATLHREEGAGARIYVKGAPERVMAMCDDVRTSEGSGPLDMEEWEARMEGLAEKGYRLLALAVKDVTGDAEALEVEQVESGCTLVGVAGLMDPPRAEAIEAVDRCRGAGIRVIMITGDHATTARSVGARMGIGDGSRALTGAQLEEMGDDELGELLRTHDVIARASPENKLRIVQLLQADGQVCSMTGDGVNDAPALKQADIGVAMGIKGSEAAKSASEMVLADDNFASIGRAVEEGRTVYDNLKKTILFILPTNGAEALIVLAAVALAFAEFPITPAQILWVNMITAVTLALALAFEPAEAGIMDRPPRRPDDPLLSMSLLRRIAYVSVLVASGCLLLFRWQLAQGVEIEYAQTVVVNSLVAAQLWYLFNCRFQWAPSIGWRALVGNRAVLIASGLLILFQAAFTYLPLLHTLFGTRPLSPMSWGPVLLVGLVLYGVVESEKLLGRHRLQREREAASKGPNG